MVNKKTVIGILIIAAALFGVGLLLARTFLLKTPLVAPKVVSFSPTETTGDVVLMPIISVTFNKNVSPEDITLTAIPEFSYRPLTTEATTTINFQPKELLLKNTLYRITLKFRFGGEQSWSFKTTGSEINAIPLTEEDLEAIRRIKEEQKAKFPPEEVKIKNDIVSALPRFAPEFWAEYFSQSDEIVVRLCQQPYEESQKKALAWFSQLGSDKLTVIRLNIQYIYGCEPPLIIPQNIQTP